MLRQGLQDGTGNRGVIGTADALVEPQSTEETAAVLAWCYENDLAIVPRGGGTGLAGGAVPSGGVVLSQARMNRVLSIDPELWRMEVESGVSTATVHRIALENGLLFPPDPGASEQSTIGGNIATNAGGPHAFKYGVTGSWVTGVEAVVPPGEIVVSGGPVRKDVAGLDLTHLMIGSEGTLGIVTSAWLRLTPAPEARGVVVAFYDDVRSGCASVSTILASGIQPTALEYLDRGALASSLGSFPFESPADAGFAVVGLPQWPDGLPPPAGSARGSRTGLRWGTGRTPFVGPPAQDLGMEILTLVLAFHAALLGSGVVAVVLWSRLPPAGAGEAVSNAAGVGPEHLAQHRAEVHHQLAFSVQRKEEILAPATHAHDRAPLEPAAVAQGGGVRYQARQCDLAGRDARPQQLPLQLSADYLYFRQLRQYRHFPARSGGFLCILCTSACPE